MYLNNDFCPIFESQSMSFPKVFTPNFITLGLKEFDKFHVATPYFKKIVKYPKIPIPERKEMLMEILKASIDPSITIISKKGKAESLFLPLLQEYFGNSIIWDKTVSYSNTIDPYIPDFIFHEPTTNLKIDIEIDEPYVLSTGEPIHFDYLENPNLYNSDILNIDDERNLFFQSKGWFVVRFSEEQVIKNGRGCCKFLAQLIFNITENSVYLNSLKDFVDLNLHLFWFLEQCLGKIFEFAI
jgi:hypothetical protein